MDKLIKMSWYVVLAVLLIFIIATVIIAATGGITEVVAIITAKFMAIMFWVLVVLYILKFAFFRKSKS